MKVLSYRKAEHPTIQGNFDLEIEKWGGVIFRNLKHMKSNGHDWIAMPAQEKEIDGEKKYFPYIQFPKEMKDAFDKKVIQAINEFFKTQG